MRISFNGKIPFNSERSADTRGVRFKVKSRWRVLRVKICKRLKNMLTCRRIPGTLSCSTDSREPQESVLSYLDL